MKKGIVKPFRERSVGWPINVDFLPTFSLQAELDSRQELYYLNAHVSEISSGKVDTGVFTDLNIEINSIPSSSQKFELKWGSKDPADETRTTQKELWEEIRQTIDIPEACIRKRGVIHPISQTLGKLPVLSGVDELYSWHTSYGNRCRSLRQRLGLKLSNPYYIIRGDLITKGIIESDTHPVLRRIKSILATDYILPDNDQGYDPLFPHALEIQRILRGNKFWKDTAIPGKIFGDINSSKIEAILYRLDTRKEDIIAL